MLKKIYQELVLIRKELQVKRSSLEPVEIILDSKKESFMNAKHLCDDDGGLFPPTEETVYAISSWYADNRVACQELRISLTVSDWCIFVVQPFYQELIQYLDNLKTQKEAITPDKVRD